MRTKMYRTTIIYLLVAILIHLVAAMKIQGVYAAEQVFDLSQERFGDFNELVATNQIRALVPYSKTFYFLDGVSQRGLTYDLLKEFEKFLNKKLKRKTMRVHVILIPTKRDRLFMDLVEGRGDIAAANLTITPQRLKLSDFSAP